MIPLRQRLLLVAGWAVAAVATGLVSAGAVAVAGGQVTDRPLRPLSAAEVAALPVTTEDDCVTIGPLASGGSDSSTGCPDRVGGVGLSTPGDDSARPAEKELGRDEFVAIGDVDAHVDPFDPSGPDVVPPNIGIASGDVVAPGTEGRFPEDVIVPPIGPRPPDPIVVDVIGGRVSLAETDGAITLNGATPRPGYVVDLRFERADELTVTFWNGSHLSTVMARIGAEGIEVDVIEGT
jgi:hypothetical protein